MKTAKRIMLCFLSFAIAISCMTGMPMVRASAENYYTAWIRNNLVGHKSVDTGGATGTQCVELCTYFVQKCLGLNATSAYGNGNQYYSGIANAFPADFTKIPYYDGLQLQPGDIVSYESGYNPTLGHAAVVYTVSGNQYSIVEQRTTSGNIITHTGLTVKKAVYGQNYTIIGVARPNKQPTAGRGYDYYAYIIRADNWKHMTYHPNGVITADDNLDDPGQIWRFARHATEDQTTVLMMPQASGDKFFGYNSPSSGSGLKVGVWNTNWEISGESGAYRFTPSGARDLALNLDDNGVYTLQPANDSVYQKFQIWNVTSPDIGTMPQTYYGSIPSSPLYYNSSSIMKGDSVVWLQRCLNNLGYSCDIDGSFGPGTKSAVQKFQSDNGLTADGSCGEATRGRIISMLAPTGYSMTAASSTIALGRIPTVTAVPNDNRKILNYSFTYITPKGTKFTYIRGTDNVFSFYPSDGAGTYQVYCDLYNDCGVYSGSSNSVYINVVNDISDAEIGSVPDYSSTGSAITPEPTVTLAGKVLKKDVDYTLTYENNVSAGAALITISGIGNFTGTRTVAFNIVSDLVSPVQHFDKDRFNAGEPLTFTWDASRDNIIDHYWVTVYAPDGSEFISKDTQKVNSFTFTPGSAGEYNIVVWAVDIYDNRVTTTSSISVDKPAGLHIPTQHYDNSLYRVGDLITLTWDTSEDGILDYYWVSVYDPDGNDYTNSGNLKNNSFSFTVDKAGLYQVIVWANDIYYNSYSDTQNIGIEEPLPVIPAPQNLRAEAGDGKVTLTWDKVDNASRYLVNSYWGGSSYDLGYCQTNSLAATGLTNGRTYGFTVRAQVNGGWSEVSEVVYATPASTKPQNVKATAGNGQVTITWDKVSGASNYVVYSYVDGKYANLGTTTNNSFTAKNLTNGKKYGFYVKAYVNGVWSDWSNSDLVYATPTGSAAKPQNVKATAGNAQVTITWDRVSGASNYVVYRYVDGNYANLGTTTSTSYTAKNLTNGKKYGFLVKAYVNGVWSDWSNSDLVYATPTGPAAKPQNVKATAGNAQVTITWDKVSGASNYVVYSYVDGNYANLGTTTSTSFTAKNLTNGKKYGFYVKAYVNGVWSDWSSADLVYATPTGPAAKPQNVKATAGNAQVTITWDKVSGASNYVVYNYVDGNYANLGTTTNNSFTAKNLTNGKKYGFLVKAYVNGVWSNWSNSDLVYATPVSPAAIKPQNVKATAGNAQVTITWDKVSGASNYVVYSYADNKYTNLGTTTSNSYTAKNLTNGKKYGFLVKAYVNGVWSDWSNSDLVYATPTGPAAKPQNVKATAGNAQVTITWDKVSGASNYVVYSYVDGNYANLGTTTSTSYTAKNLTNGKKYGFLVKAYVNGVWSDWSNSDLVYATPASE